VSRNSGAPAPEPARQTRFLESGAIAYPNGMTDRELVARIARSSGGKAGYKQLVRELGLGGGRERRMLLEQLTRLTARGRLMQIDREHWTLARQAAAGDNLAAGRLDLHRDGYGFVRPNSRQQVTEDIFIPPHEINGAMQGDQVLVELEPPKADGRRQGRIVRIVERRNPSVVGTFHYARAREWSGESPHPPGWHVVIPSDGRLAQPILIPPDEPLPAPREAPGAHRLRGGEAILHESLEGLIVDVEITRWPTPTRPPAGRVIEVLGAPDDFGVDVEMTIRKHQLPRIFPDDVLAEARNAAHLNENEVQDENEVRRRVDFRDRPIVTIDGETARDFDDAVLVTERIDAHGDPGFELQVHIADVAQYVAGGGALDREARLRGTSVYFPDRAIPMLPHELSSGICSLRPHEDRLVLSCIMQLDSTGRVESYEICEGVIRSAARMTYTEVHAILEGDIQARARYAPLLPEFERMRRVAMLMNKRREERGSIDFDLPEPVIEFDEHGQMSGVTRAERTWANRLIEEFMLAANECVATWLEDLSVPSLYRIHEKPEPRRVVQFEELAAGFGVSLGLGPLPVKRVQTRGERRDMHGRGRNPRMHEVPEDIAVTPRMYQKLAARIEGKPEERILSYLMLRSLMQARYSEVNEGHFALATPTYTHFTSPIRRYPDLIVHRIAKSLLRSGISGTGTVGEERLNSPWSHPSETMDHALLPARRKKGAGTEHAQTPAMSQGFQLSRNSALRAIEPPIPEAELAQIAEETSQAERRAADAERELVEWKKVRFMQDRVGEEFSALVLNPAKYGLFVELTDLFVEGLVPIDTLRGDRYTWRENTHEIVGERWGRRFRAGDRVQVILDRILAQERKLQFALVEEGIQLTGKKTPPPGKKTKKKKNAKSDAGAGNGSRKARKAGPHRRRG
jgi:ribonuclease R